MAHHNSNPGCVCCIRTRVKAPWDKCLDKDVSGNKLCLEKVIATSDSVIQSNPSQHSHKFRQAQMVKNPGRTVYGRWSRAKWDKTNKRYTMLNCRR